MQYFIIEKVCENACKLILAGESFDCAAEYARWSNRDRYNTIYIVTEGQMQNIFFSGWSQERISEYLKGHFRCIASESKAYLYMPLPSNFREYITDFKWFINGCE